MFGWSINASAWRSLSKRATTCRLSIPGLISLRATSRRIGSTCFGVVDDTHPAFPEFPDRPVRSDHRAAGDCLRRRGQSGVLISGRGWRMWSRSHAFEGLSISPGARPRPEPNCPFRGPRVTRKDGLHPFDVVPSIPLASSTPPGRKTRSRSSASPRIARGRYWLSRYRRLLCDRVREPITPSPRSHCHRVDIAGKNLPCPQKMRCPRQNPRARTQARTACPGERIFKRLQAESRRLVHAGAERLPGLTFIPCGRREWGRPPLRHQKEAVADFPGWSRSRADCTQSRSGSTRGARRESWRAASGGNHSSKKARPSRGLSPTIPGAPPPTIRRSGGRGLRGRNRFRGRTWVTVEFQRIMKLQGIFPPITTPFDHEGKIYVGKLQHNVEKWNRTALSGYVVMGSTGESVMLTEEEKFTLWERVAERGARKTADCGHRRGERARNRVPHQPRGRIGYKAVMVRTPHYYKNLIKRADAQMLYYRSVADQAKLPLIIYNWPQTTGRRYSGRSGGRASRASQHHRHKGELGKSRKGDADDP